MQYLLLHFSSCDNIRSKMSNRAQAGAYATGFITDKSECKDAALKLGLVENTAMLLRDSYSTFDPRGCILIGGYGGRYDLKWNANVYSRKKCSSLERCICRVEGVEGLGNQTSDDWWQGFEETSAWKDQSYFSWFVSMIFILACISLLGYLLSMRRKRSQTRRGNVRRRRRRRRVESEERFRMVEMKVRNHENHDPEVLGPGNSLYAVPEPVIVTAIPVYSDPDANPIALPVVYAESVATDGTSSLGSREMYPYSTV